MVREFISEYFFPVKEIQKGIPIKCNDKAIPDEKLIVQPNLLENSRENLVNKIIKTFSI